jgi:hypothetical protein
MVKFGDRNPDVQGIVEVCARIVFIKAALFLTLFRLPATHKTRAVPDSRYPSADALHLVCTIQSPN